MKYYAHYSLGTPNNGYFLYSEKEFKILLQQHIEMQELDKYETLINEAREFETFKEAKQWIIEGMRLDISDLKHELAKVKRIKKSGV